MADLDSSDFRNIKLPATDDSGNRMSILFGVRFRQLDGGTMRQLTTVPQGYKPPATGEAVLEADTGYIMKIAEGWRYVMDVSGEEVPFTRDNVRVLLDNYPNARTAIVSEFFETIAA